MVLQGLVGMLQGTFRGQSPRKILEELPFQPDKNPVNHNPFTQIYIIPEIGLYIILVLISLLTNV